MTIDQCFYFGKLIRLRGTDGTLVMAAEVDHPNHYHNLKAIFVDLDGRLLQMNIAQIKVEASGTIRFEHTDAQAAALLIGCSLYLPLSELPVLIGNDFYYHEIMGFTVSDESFGPIGVIEAIYDMPQHAVASINYQSKEVLIPLLKIFVKSVNRENRQLYMQLPDGLMDVYL
jgi:16S rRNA processing protein RimM